MTEVAAAAAAAAAAITRALASNLFLQPAVVSSIVQYWMWHFGTLVGHAEGKDPLAFYRLMMKRPTELLLRGQVATYPTPDTQEPRPLYMIHFAPPANDMTLAVPDEFLVEFCGFKTIGACLAAMAANPSAYWSNVSHGGQRGHLVAECFRHATIFADLYHPALFVLYTLIYAIANWWKTLGEDMDMTVQHRLVQEQVVPVIRECEKLAGENSLEKAVFRKLLSEVGQYSRLVDVERHIVAMLDHVNAFALRLYARVNDEITPHLPLQGKGDPDLMLQACLPAEQDLFAWIV